MHRERLSKHLHGLLFLLCVVSLLSLFPSIEQEASAWTATGSLSTERWGHTATTLANGRVLVVGGVGASNNYLSTCEIYNPSTGVWTKTGSLSTGRFLHTATLLPGGKVLVAGGVDNNHNLLYDCEIYDPATKTWSATGSLINPRCQHTATLLGSGKVLVAGGANGGEIYDPNTGAWTATAGLATERYNHTATLLKNGKVLVAGGKTFGPGTILSGCEIYDPSVGAWTATGSLANGREFHTATLLANGRVLITGGEHTSDTPSSSCEIYDPSNGLWTATGSLADARANHTATLLSSGRVLVSGSWSGGNALSGSELYGPAVGAWTEAQNLITARGNHTATLLAGDKVLVAGGLNGSGLSSCEIYDPTSATVPGAPTGVTATAGNGQATVSFKLPADGGSPITNCTATSKPGGKTGKGIGSPIVVTGLTNDTAYTFRVTATNSVGTGPPSDPSNSVTPYASGSLAVTIKPAAAAGAGARWRVDGGTWNKSNAKIAGLKTGTHKVTFKAVSGWTTPAGQSLNILNGQTTSASAQYVRQTGSLTVTIDPAAAIAAGAQWNVDGGTWYDSGVQVGSLPVGLHTVAFKAIEGWTTPAAQSVDIQTGLITQANGLYVKQTGSLTVIIVPEAAISAGAQWRVDGGAWHGSGTKVKGLPVGAHKVSFKAVSGWTTPANQRVTIENGRNTTIAGTYTKPITFVLPESLGKVRRCSNFNYQIAAPTGGAGAPYTFKLGTLGGFPPLNITVAPSGLVSGIASSPVGVYSFEVCVDDVGGGEVCKPTTIQVTAPSAPGTVSGPSPASGATNVSTSRALRWNETANATSYDVYFGTTSPPPKVATKVPQPVYTPGTLNTNTTYYWQIIARHDMCGGVKPIVTGGPVWSFTTTASEPLSLKITSSTCAQTWSNCTAFCSAQDTITIKGSACGPVDAYFNTGSGDSLNCGAWQKNGFGCQRNESQTSCTNWTFKVSADFHGQTRSGDITIHDYNPMDNPVTATWTAACPQCSCP